MRNLIPLPTSTAPTEGVFTLTPATQIYLEPATPELMAIGEYLAEKLRPPTGYALEIVSGTPPAPGHIQLTIHNDDETLGEEGYELTITPDGVRLTAPRPAGLFRGIQTLRQCLPPAIDSAIAQPGPWTAPAGTVRDIPRFAWRGAMLDVARHFFPVEEVKRYMDLLAYYKINRFHLHLTDDQGWRIEIKKWPRLTEYGGSTQVGGGPGGYYTQADYADLVAYAARRYITLIPEIDLPGHTEAALAAYPELNCSERTPALYTDTKVGFSTLCVQNDLTYQFLDDVIGELAALTPGPYIHIGGDEAKATTFEDYVAFIPRVQAIVTKHGKQIIGWEEIGQSDLTPPFIAQQWFSYHAKRAARLGGQIILSPASKIYLDMKYDATTPLGLDWAGLSSVHNAYSWNPATYIDGLGEEQILGLESPLWTETVQTRADLDYLAFPRILGVTELGWSPARGRSWKEYQARLAAHGPRLTALGVNFYRSEEVAWE